MGAERPLDRDLIQAARSGSLSKITALLAKGADAKAFNGRALEAAVQAGHVTVARELLQRGAPISFRALKHAVTQGPFELLRVLVDGGANLNQVGRWDVDDARKGFTTPLIAVVLYSSSTQPEAKVKLLLAKGAQASKALPDGSTALDVAMRFDKQQEALLLVEHGAALEKHQKTLLMWAMQSKEPSLLRALEKRGAVPSKLSFAQFDFPTSPVAVKAILAAGGDPRACS